MSKYFEKRKSDDQLYYNYLTKNKYKDYMKDRNKYPELKILGDPHFLRFFNNDYEEYIKEELVKRIKPYQRIKNKIEPNPYVEEHENIIRDREKLFSHLCEQLARYYKTNQINENFFTNYFNKLTNQLKSHAINFHGILPQSIEEILNDIQQKVEIIKSLRFYLKTNVIGRASTYFEQFPFDSNDDSFIIFDYKVINEENLKNSSFELLEYLNGRNGKKLRRPIGIAFNSYNYLPIPCQGQCMEKAKKTFENICSYIQSDHTKYYQNDKYIGTEFEYQKNTSLCEECKKYLNEDDVLIDDIKKKLEEEIKIMYYRTCIFCHNINEYIFHPLVYHISKNKIYSNYPIKLIKDVHTVIYDPKYSNKNYNISYDIRKLYHENDRNIELIIKYLNIYNSRNNILDRIMFLPDIKTKICLLSYFFFLEKNILPHDYSKCKFYHNTNLEKRRNTIIKRNEICPERIIKKGNTILWKLNNELNQNHKNDCDFFHTRNEVFFDRRNYRKLYICPKDFCDLGELCPYKHPIDIRINEIYLPEKYREELRKKQKLLIDFNNKIMNEVKNIPKCIICKKKLGIKFIVCECENSYCWECQNYCNQACQICNSKNHHLIDLTKNQSLNIIEPNIHDNKKKGNNSMLYFLDDNNKNNNNNNDDDDDESSIDDINNSMDDDDDNEKKKMNISKQYKNYDFDNSMANPSFVDINKYKEKGSKLVNPYKFPNKYEKGNGEENEDEDEDEEEDGEENGEDEEDEDEEDEENGEDEDNEEEDEKKEK